MLGFVHNRGEFWHFRPELVGDVSPLSTGGPCRFLSEGRTDKG